MYNTGKTQKVVCVIKYYCKNNSESLVNLKGGLVITPEHPININGDWILPN